MAKKKNPWDRYIKKKEETDIKEEIKSTFKSYDITTRVSNQLYNAFIDQCKEVNIRPSDAFHLLIIAFAKDKEFAAYLRDLLLVASNELETDMKNEKGEEPCQTNTET